MANANTESHKRYRLTFDDAVEVWKMHWAGEYQHHIAAKFGVNQGRICEVLHGELLPGSREAALNVGAA